jgi:hypothetical protein
MTALIVVLAVLAAAACAAFVYIVVSDESAGTEVDVTLSDVVENPARYEGEHVAISGEWADNDYFSPDQADQVIVLGADADRRLLVVPNLGVDVPELDDDDVLAVKGVVRIPERGDPGFVAPDALMERAGGGVAPVLRAESVDLVSGPDTPLATEADRATVEQLLRDPRAFDERAVVVGGTVKRVVDRGFALADDGAAIFVSAPRSKLGTLDPGQLVRIRAELTRLSAYGADALEHALATDPPGDQPRSSLDVGDVPIEVGEPYLLLRAVDEQA